MKVFVKGTHFEIGVKPQDMVPVTTSTKEVAVPMKILITTYLEVCKIADGILLCNHVPRILNKHFRGKPYYVDVVDLFNEHIKSFLKWVKIGMGRYGSLRNGGGYGKNQKEESRKCTLNHDLSQVLNTKESAQLYVGNRICYLDTDLSSRFKMTFVRCHVTAVSGFSDSIPAPTGPSEPTPHPNGMPDEGEHFQFAYAFPYNLLPVLLAPQVRLIFVHHQVPVSPDTGIAKGLTIGLPNCTSDRKPNAALNTFRLGICTHISVKLIL
ncbi:FPP synthase 1 [Artemisia annua]|uniref:FPP synthase 1 n=1 Tax=Artemisia annua TaxID=35608 RepID=A0A2U1N6E7_ARTAN|nr:FPP synthase 1 [Artemisia annua]